MYETGTAHLYLRGDPDMRCPDLETWTASYGGETEESVSRRLAEHLQSCSRCQDVFDQLCGLGAAMRGALAAPARPQASRLRSIRSPRPSWIPLAVAASFAAAALGLVSFVKESRVAPEAAVVRTRAVIEERPVPGAPSPAEAPSVPPALPAPPSKPLPVEPAEPAAALRPEVPPPPPIDPPPSAPATPEPLKFPAPPEPAATRPAEPAVIIAVLERCEGDVSVTSSAGRLPSRQNQALSAGQGLATAGARSRAVVRFPDGTRMELGEKSTLGQISDHTGARGIGRWMELQEGTLTLDVAPQPADRAMLIASPHGEARVVGTVLRLVVEPGEKGSTRLEVLEGKVRLTRQGAGVDVHGGFTATAAAGGELAARPLPKLLPETLCKFTFEDGRLPKAFESGTLERGPERAGSRFCIAGAMIPGGTSGGHVKLNDDGKGLFVYSDDLFLAFDYWADDSVRTLDLHMWSRAQQTTFGTTVWNTPREQWTHLVLPLADFVRTEAERLLHLKPGEAVPNLWIQAGQVGGKLYLDNLEILRIRKREARR
jgi:ferric-dicitrate binding protein FerR (iron transport regulator)